MPVFTYGSLMFPAIWQRVVRGSYRALPATAAGFARYAVREATYPGMVREPGAAVEGVVYLDVDATDLAALDAFEGDEYRRETITVRLADGARLTADAYVFLAVQRLLPTPWEPEAFQAARFMASYCPDERGK